MGRCYAILRQVTAAWQDKDIDGVVAHLAEDIVWHYAAAALPPVRGRAAARRLMEKMQADMSRIHWRIFAHVESGDRLFVEGVDDYRTADGRRVAVPYAGVLEFQGDLITGWRDYLDLGVIASQKAGQPISAQVEDLLAREEEGLAGAS